MTEFTMPSLGADMDEGTLVEWLVSPGDTVTKGDVVAVVETAKSTIEVECFDSGTVGALLVAPGTKVPVGTPMAVIGPAAEPTAHTPAQQPPEPSPGFHAVSVRAVTPAGDAVSTPLVRHLAQKKDIDLSTVHGSGKGGQITRADVEKAASPPRHRVPASPLARRLARSLDVDLDRVRGTGRNGTVKADDVRVAAGDRSHRTHKPRPPAPGLSAAPPVRPSVRSRPDSLTAGVPTARSAISALMTRANRDIPHYYLSTTVDLAAATTWMLNRNANRPVGERLVPAALLLKSVALAARQVPELNGYWKDGAFVPAGGVRLGIAVSLRGGGLAAPAVANADTMSLPELMKALKDLVSRARGGRLRASEAADPTLTVTNLGDQGVETVFGVIYPPQVALVGLGCVVERPVAVDGMLTVHPTVTATLSADHRASDGATGARFLTALDRLLQRPEEL
ncbi:dihydrolipoamide acetyltransferase family protein [Streptomyces sp. NBC_01618]|uniref:dihydrolipoamide acetyltransferase family protein n=1 Tax=Streptomyces sp. NBC_01618 TaxID=2975900 RepID=UPI0038702064|nr:2-oxo acid dehydrogenase subunit E2 [Streptomyces sp. NBC_01618]